MKKMFIGILILTLVFAAASALAAEQVVINARNFPDPVFREYVKQFDDNWDGVLSAAERDRVESMGLNAQQDLKDMTGLEHFAKLEYLSCTFNTSLKSLDVSHNPKLIHLDCSRSPIRSLDVKHNPRLTALSCQGCDLKALDVTGNPELYSLYCGGNGLTGLDLSANTKLVELDCSSGCLETLDISNNKALKKLYCNGNRLTELDTSFCPLLVDVACGNNQIPVLSFKGNPKLKLLNCDNGVLTRLDLSGNPALEELFCESNRLTELDLSHNKKLTSLCCGINHLRTLDLKQNTRLRYISCVENDLVCLDLTANKRAAFEPAECAYNVRSVAAKAGRVFFSDFPGFDPRRASNWTNCAVRDDCVIVNGEAEVTYDYRIRKDVTGTFNLKVSPVRVKLASVELKAASLTYTGEEIVPDLTVKAKADGRVITLEKDIDYTVTCANNVNRGTAKVTVSGIGGCRGSLTKKFRIAAAPIIKVTVNKASVLYTGQALRPAVTVKAKPGGKTVTLEEGKDYKAYYKNNVKAGTATVIVKGKGNYTGTLQKTFTIKPVKILKVTLDADRAAYTGEPVTPGVTVRTKTGGALKVLTEGKDYTVTYADNVEKGIASVTVKGIGNYTGTIVKYFTIE